MQILSARAGVPTLNPPPGSAPFRLIRCRLLSPAAILTISVAVVPLWGLALLRCSLNHALPALRHLFRKRDTHEVMLNFPSTLPWIPLVRWLGLATRGISSVSAKETGFIKHHKYWIAVVLGTHRKGNHDGSRWGLLELLSWCGERN